MAIAVPLLEQEPIPTPSVLAMDATRGRIPSSVFDIEEIDPDKRLTLVRAARIIGSAIAPGIEGAEPIMTELQISDENLKQVIPAEFKKGLFVDMDEVRLKWRKGEDIDQACWATGEIPFLLPRTKELHLEKTAVIVPPAEYLLIGQSFRKLGEAVRTKTRGSEANKNNPDRIDAARKIGSASAKVTHQRLVKMASHREDLIAEDAMLRRVYNESRYTWSAHYTSSKVDKMRRDTGEVLHEMLDTAAIYLNPGVYTLRAMHRALNYKLHKEGDAKAMAQNWRVMTSAAGQFNHSRQIKTAQAMAICREEYGKYRMFIKPDERPVFDMLASV